MRGFCGIGIYKTKNPINVGTLWRSAHMLGAAFIFTIGQRYKAQSSDTLKSPRHIPLYHYEDFDLFQAHRPHDALLIGIELVDSARELSGFTHPERAIYLLGAEDTGLPAVMIDKCQHVIKLDTPNSLNVSTMGSIVLYDRQAKQRRPV